MIQVHVQPRSVCDLQTLIELCRSRIADKATLGGIADATGYSVFEIEALTSLIEGGNPL